MSDLSDIDVPHEVALIINLRSRSGTAVAHNAPRELERQGVKIRETCLIRDGSELVEAARGAVARGVPIVAVGGGDGTISAVVDVLANRSDVALGLLPVGTGNEVARVLGIPLDLRGACRVISQGRVAAVDLPAANGNFFIHTALIGHPAHVNHEIPSWLKSRFGKVAYLYSFLSSILHTKPFRVRLTVGNAHWEGETVIVVIGNGRLHVPGRVLLPFGEEASRGLLVYAPRDRQKLTLLRLAFGLWVTRRRQPSLLLSFTADSATVWTDPSQEIDLDGEFGQRTPVDFRLARGALRVLVPDPSVQDTP